MNLASIREAKASKVAECRALLTTAESAKRALSADESQTFDRLKGEITTLEADETRASFLADAERASTGGERLHGDDPLGKLEQRVSLHKLLRAGVEQRALDGAEREYNAEITRRNGRQAKGSYFPLAALEQRVNTAAGAGQLVGTDHRADLYIEPLRNALLARRLGVRVLAGLTESVSIPKFGSGVSVGWVADNTALSSSDMTFASVGLTPKHVGVLSEMSRQLIQQSSPDIEGLLRADMSFAVAQAIDSAIIKGGGTNQPTGILATSGIQTGTLATPTWEQVLALLAKGETANVAPNAWLMSPAVAEVLRGTLKSASAGANYLLDGGNMADLPVYVTNQVPTEAGSPATGIAILGDFTQVILGIWSELDVLVNPYESTAYARGGVSVRAMATCDIAVRHPEAFVVATDVALA